MPQQLILNNYMKKIRVLALFLICFLQTSAQWVSHYSTGQGTDVNLINAVGLSCTVDAAGNCYVTGYTYNQGTGNDIFVVKYNPNGDTLWTRTYNGTENSDDYGAA